MGQDPLKVLILVSIHHLNTKLWGNYEQRYMYSTRTIFAVKLVAVEALLYKERTRSQHAHCSKVNGQASSRQLCIAKTLQAINPKISVLQKSSLKIFPRHATVQLLVSPRSQLIQS